MILYSGVFPNGMGFKVALFVGDAVDVHGAIAALSGNVFIQWIPSDSLNIVVMFSYLLHTFAWGG
jgi:hypothetical protein